MLRNLLEKNSIYREVNNKFEAFNDKNNVSFIKNTLYLINNSKIVFDKTVLNSIRHISISEYISIIHSIKRYGKELWLIQLNVKTLNQFEKMES